LALKPAFVVVSKEEAFATDEHGNEEMPKRCICHGRTRKFRAGSVSDGKHRNTLATDEHGIRIEKTGIKHSHREDAKSAKENKKSKLVCCFFAVLASLR